VQAAAGVFIGWNDEVHNKLFAAAGGILCANPRSHGPAAIADLGRPGEIYPRLTLNQVQMFHPDAMLIGHEQGKPIAVDATDFSDVIPIKQRESGEEEDFIRSGITVLDRRQRVQQDQIGNGRLQAGFDPLGRCPGQDQLFRVELVFDDVPHLADG